MSYRLLALPAVLAATTVAGCSGAAPAAGPPAPTTAAVSTATTSAVTSTSSSPTTRLEPVDAAFVKTVEPVCTDWVTRAQGHQYTGEGGPRAATAADLPMAASYLDGQPVSHEGQTKLAALGAPANGAATWAVVQSDVGAYQKAAGQAVAAARSGQVPAWQTAFDQYYAALNTVRSDLLAAGFSVNGSCLLLFTQGGGH